MGSADEYEVKPRGQKRKTFEQVKGTDGKSKKLSIIDTTKSNIDKLLNSTIEHVQQNPNSLIHRAEVMIPCYSI